MSVFTNPLISSGSSPVSSTAAPGASDDGYPLGQLWVNTNTDKAYFCVDNTISAAKWEDVDYGDVVP